MATVTLVEFKGTRTLQLSAPRAAMVEAELRRLGGGWLGRWLTRLLTPSVPSFASAPDCLIRIDDGRNVREYELHAGYFLRRVGESPRYRFYMGLLLLDWLYGNVP